MQTWSSASLRGPGFDLSVKVSCAHALAYTFTQPFERSAIALLEKRWLPGLAALELADKHYASAQLRPERTRRLGSARPRAPRLCANALGSRAARPSFRRYSASAFKTLSSGSCRRALRASASPSLGSCSSRARRSLHLAILAWCVWTMRSGTAYRYPRSSPNLLRHGSVLTPSIEELRLPIPS